MEGWVAERLDSCYVCYLTPAAKPQLYVSAVESVMYIVIFHSVSFH